jgi:hypothetical protein
MIAQAFSKLRSGCGNRYKPSKVSCTIVPAAKAGVGGSRQPSKYENQYRSAHFRKAEIWVGDNLVLGLPASVKSTSTSID